MKDTYAQDILIKVCDVHGVKIADVLENQNRIRDVVLAKTTCVHFLLKRYPVKFVQRLLSYKSHASINHAKKIYRSMMATDIDFIYKSLSVMDNKVYICGKTLPAKVSIKTFGVHEAFIESNNYNVINIMNIAPSIRDSDSFMTLRIRLLKKCEYIYVLDNAKDCEDARIELEIANKLGIKVWKI